MKNIIKNLYLVLTAVCLVALAVFLVQLIVINSGTEPEEPASVISGSASVQEDGEPDEADNPFADYVPPPPTPRPQPQGVRNELLIYDNTLLVVYAQSDLFDFTENEFDWSFRYKGGGNAALEIGFAYLSAQVGADAEDFLNKRVGNNVAEYRGAQEILDSQINAFSVTGRDGGVTYEAWLHRIPDSDLAVTFLINYEFNGQRDDLYTVLSSMSIIGQSEGHSEGQGESQNEGQDEEQGEGEG